MKMLERLSPWRPLLGAGLALAISMSARAADPKHVHPEHGPHHGALVELGDEEYHAELLHDDDTDTVTIYILDGSAKHQVPIEAKDVALNAKLDGKPVQFKLPALPDRFDPAGKSSRFAGKGHELCEVLDSEKADVRLRVTIAGKSYTGKVEHHHDHPAEKK